MMTAWCLSLSFTAWSYDTKMAESYAKFFSEASGAEAGKSLHFIDSETFMNDVKAGKDIVAVDVRTPAETSVISLSLGNSLRIPVDQLFKAENLDRIPTDKPVVVICKSGVRATAVGTSLRHIGFNNVYILTGGFQALSSYYGPGQAYAKPEAVKK
jgi:rhodanese-related sulfurtransferase